MAGRPKKKSLAATVASIPVETCVFCKEQQPPSGQFVNGLRLQPVPGSEVQVFLCWECAIGIEKMVHEQLAILAHYHINEARENMLLLEAQQQSVWMWPRNALEAKAQ